MIVSVSRRTDIPAFYSKWFLNRVRQGSCLVPNPFNRQQVTEIDLSPGQVDAFVFWTRNPRPLMPHLEELDARGYHYYFLFTLIGYPKRIDPGSPQTDTALKTFLELSERIGPDRVTWRYDPIVLSELTGPDFHRVNFHRIARELNGAVRRCIISFVRPYRKARSRLEAAAPGSTAPVDFESPPVRDLLFSLAEGASANGMEIFSCAGEEDFPPFGIHPSKCIDPELILKITGTLPDVPKDPYQRKECGCAASKDIGMYDSCLFGCSYCYATSSHDRARENNARHNPESPSLISVNSKR